MSRIPVSHKNRIRGETRDRIRSELNISTAQQAALDLKADISSLGTAAYADLTTSPTDPTANRVTKVGDFGLGGEVIACPNVDLNDVVVTGFYDISGATLNKPPTLSPTNAVCMTIVRTSDNMVQMVYNRRSHQIFQRYKNTTWSSWTEVLTTETLNGDIAITGSFLADDPATTRDWNDNWQTGFYEGSGAANGPTASGWYWGLKSGHSNNSAVTRYGMDLVIQNGGDSKPFIRSTNNSGIGTWQQIHTSTNTNSYQFITNNIGERLLEGVGISNTEVDCPLPTSSFTYPASLTAVGGYELRDSRNSAFRGTNLLPVLSPLSTPKTAYARFTTTSIQIGERYRIIASTANSKITVNF